jgi:aspartyl-tRNA(Asn)/glutamyl-tRNA(Gln) amidotransferase subunit C
MAQLNQQTIRTLKQLCRIDCTAEEEASLLQDLEKILYYCEQLAEVDTTDVPPCYQVIEDMTETMRDDEVCQVLPRNVFLANAPAHTGGMIRVPPILKKQS